MVMVVRVILEEMVVAVVVMVEWAKMGVEVGVGVVEMGMTGITRAGVTVQEVKERSLRWPVISADVESSSESYLVSHFIAWHINVSLPGVTAENHSVKHVPNAVKSALGMKPSAGVDQEKPPKSAARRLPEKHWLQV